MATLLALALVAPDYLTSIARAQTTVSHEVFVRLMGFASVTRDNLLLRPGESQMVNFQLRIAPICEM